MKFYSFHTFWQKYPVKYGNKVILDIVFASRQTRLYIHLSFLKNSLCNRNWWRIFAIPSEGVLRTTGVVVQLVRIRACHARGRGFESRPFRFFNSKIDKNPLNDII